MRLRHHGNTYMGRKTRAGQRHTVTWPAGSRGRCARGPWIETLGCHHSIAYPIWRQIGFSGSGVRVNIMDILQNPIHVASRGNQHVIEVYNHMLSIMSEYILLFLTYSSVKNKNKNLSLLRMLSFSTILIF